MCASRKFSFFDFPRSSLLHFSVSFSTSFFLPPPFPFHFTHPLTHSHTLQDCSFGLLSMNENAEGGFAREKQLITLFPATDFRYQNFPFNASNVPSIRRSFPSRKMTKRFCSQPYLLSSLSLKIFLCLPPLKLYSKFTVFSWHNCSPSWAFVIPRICFNYHLIFCSFVGTLPFFVIRLTNDASDRNIQSRRNYNIFFSFYLPGYAIFAFFLSLSLPLPLPLLLPLLRSLFLFWLRYLLFYFVLCRFNFDDILTFWWIIHLRVYFFRPQNAFF